MSLQRLQNRISVPPRHEHARFCVDWNSPDGKHQGSEAGLKMMSRSAVRQNALRFLLFAIVAVGVGIPLGWLAFVGLALIGF
jgi:hypothetical protein